MASVGIDSIRGQYPGKSDSEIAKLVAHEEGWVIVIKYKLLINGDYSHFGLCATPEDADAYFDSPNCHDEETLYDWRWE